MSADAVSRAYAILGLQRGSTRAQVKQQYKALVRKWHPDRYANDPIGRVEATDQLRRINDAFKTLDAVAQASAAPPPVAPRRDPAPAAPDAPREPPTYYGRPLTEAEIDRISRAIGRPDPVGFSMSLFGVILPASAAIMVLFPRPDKRLSWLELGEGLFFAGVAFAIWFRRFRNASQGLVRSGIAARYWRRRSHR